MSTFMANRETVKQKWLLIDATDLVVGRLVRHAEEKHVSLRDLSADDLRAVDAVLSLKILQALDPARAVAARSLVGGPAPAAVERELARLEAELRAVGHEP